MDSSRAGSLDEILSSRSEMVGSSKLIFCLRDEYRTAFDTLLPKTAAQSARFALMPFQPEVAAEVLRLLLASANVEYDQDFLVVLCDRIADGVPRRVLPAVLQLIVQYCQNHGAGLDANSWSQMTVGKKSLFEEHISDTVLVELPRKVQKLAAIKTLLALTAGEVRSGYKDVETIVGESGLNLKEAQYTLEIASLPTARVVVPEVESEATKYRLVHDLLVPAVRALHRRALLDSERRKRAFVMTALGTLLAAAVLAGGFAGTLAARLRAEKTRALARQLAAQSQLLLQGSPRLFEPAALLAVEAARRSPSADADKALRAALSLMPKRVSGRRQPGFGDGGGIAFTVDTHEIVSIGEDGLIARWNPVTGALVSSFRAGRIGAFALDREGRRVAAATGYEFQGSPKVAIHGNIVRVFRADGAVVAQFYREKNIEAVALSPDGTSVASLDEAGLLELYSLAERKVLRSAQFETYSDIFKSLRFSPSGRYLAFAQSRDEGEGLCEYYSGTAIVLRVPDLVEVGRSVGHFSGIMNDLTFSNDERYIATASEYGTASVLTPAGADVMKMRDSDLQSVAFSPDGRRLATASADFEVRIWEVGSGLSLAHMKHQGAVRRVVFDPTGDHVLTASDDGTARIWEVASGEEVSRLAHPDRVVSIAFSGDGQLAASASADGTILVWETPHAPKLFNTRYEDSGEFGGLSSDGKYFLKVKDSKVHLIEISSGRTVYRLPSSDGIRAFALDRKGQILALLGTDEISLWRLGSASQEAAKIRDLPSGSTSDWPLGLALGDSGRRVAFWGTDTSGDPLDDQALRIWDVATGEELLFRSGGVGSIAQSPRGQLIGVDEGDLRLYSAEAGAEVGILHETDVVGSTAPAQALSDSGLVVFKSPGEPFFIHQIGKGRSVPLALSHADSAQVVELAFAPDDSLILATTEGPSGRQVHVLRSKDGKEVGVYSLAKSDEFGPQAVHPRSQRLALVTKPGLVEVRDLARGVSIAALAHEGEVRDLAFSPDGGFLATTTDDLILRVWDLRNGALMARLEPSRIGNRLGLSVEFTPDGKYICSVVHNLISGARRESGLWLWRTKDLISEVCSRAGRNLTQGEWQLYMGAETYRKTCSGLP